MEFTRRSKRRLNVLGATTVLLMVMLGMQPASGHGDGSVKGRGERFEPRSRTTTGAELGPVIFSSFDPIDFAAPADAATPYPATVPYDWCPGTITDVDVFIYGVTSTFPDDIDIVIEHAGQSAKVMSDVGGDIDITDFSFGFDDEAATPAPDAGPLADLTIYQPLNVDPLTDTMPTPAPDPTGSALTVFDGTSPAGAWNLYVRDDVPATDGGEIVSGFDVALTVTSTVSGTRVCIPHGGRGEPYPSEQTISGQPPSIQDLNVSLTGLSHTWPDDLDAVLQGPGGQYVMLMSDAGSDEVTPAPHPISNVNLTFDDEAATGLSDTAQITSGSYRPSSYPPAETLPGPAPGPPYGTSLAAFDGTNPNGTWRLFINDDTGFDQGILSSWSITLGPGAAPGGAVTVTGGKVKEGKSRSFTVTRSGNVGSAGTVSYATKNGSAKAGKDYKAASGSLNFAAGEATKTVKVKTKDDRRDEKKERFFLTATSGGVTAQGAAKIKDND